MRGGDSGGLRAYNERLILSTLLRAEALSKAELARETGLSGQSATVIVNRLLADGLLIKCPKVRGQVGQPSTPIAPNPDGAYSLGIKIGRRSVEAVIVNLLGRIVDRKMDRYDAPLPSRTVERAAELATACLDGMEGAARARVVGLGVAMPDNLESWADELGLPSDALSGWVGLDVEKRLAAATGLPVTRYNDATAACAAEMIGGTAIATRSALYVFLGTFTGGGVVLDGRLYFGEQRNAGAIGSMCIASNGRRQLIHASSLVELARRLEADGHGTAVMFSGGSRDADAVFEAWAASAAPVLAHAIVASLAVIDFETVVIDGLLNPAWQRRMIERVSAEIEHFDRTGLAPAKVVAGTIGPPARVLGAALLPLHERVSPDAELLVRPARHGSAGVAGDAA